MDKQGARWVSLADAAELAGVSYNYLQAKVAAGHLPACHPDRGRIIRIRLSDLELFMEGPPAVRKVDPLPARAVVVHPRVGARRRARRRANSLQGNA